MTRRRLLASVLAGLALLPAAAQAQTWTTISKPIDQSNLTSLPYGYRSHWIQPWRSYLDTPPATRLRDGMGMNFGVSPTEALFTAKLLKSSGIRRARLELSWNQLAYGDPTRFADPASRTKAVAALRQYGIRPLILLNSNHLEPTPAKRFLATLKASAAKGATKVLIDSVTAAAVKPGLTGLDAEGMAAGVLIKSVAADGTATLSRPLPNALPAGKVPATTLMYEPFAQPYLSTGAPNPRFERTLAGWLQYVGTTTRFVKNVLGTDDFDVEIWNELGFGSKFLWNSFYYSPTPDKGSGDPTRVLLKRTVAYLRDPANGVPRVRITDGFASQTPWISGSTELLGVDAMSKHPYSNGMWFPKYATIDRVIPVDALGNPDYTEVETGGLPNYRDSFIPTYREFMPEHFLTGIQTETLIRDIGPFTTSVYGVSHGRNTAPPGGTPPAVWITEHNLDMGIAMQRYTPQLTPAEVQRIQAKTALRIYVSHLNLGVSVVHLFTAKGSSRWQLVAPAFYSAIAAHPTTYPTVDPGLPINATRRMAAKLTGIQPISRPRPLALRAIADNHGHIQFAGDGSASHPSLYDRDALAFFPFQVNDHRWLAAVYVMTRDVTKINQPSRPAGDPLRFDLPQSTFRLTIGGINGTTATVSLYDPLVGLSRPATIVARTADSILVELAASDSPRMLTIDDTA